MSGDARVTWSMRGSEIVGRAGCDFNPYGGAGRGLEFVVEFNAEFGVFRDHAKPWGVRRRFGVPMLPGTAVDGGPIMGGYAVYESLARFFELKEAIEWCERNAENGDLEP